MKIVKSWKKNLKRTGALALATLVMCGGASFARAEDAENITLNQLGSDSTVEEKYNEKTGNYETGNVKTVLGYQTEAAIGYAANISWGDMIFVYDNGTYDPETGRLIATASLGADKVQGGAQYTNPNSFDVYNDGSSDYYKFSNGEYYSLYTDEKFTGEKTELALCATTSFEKYVDTTNEKEYYKNRQNRQNPEKYFTIDDHEEYDGTGNLSFIDDRVLDAGHWYGFDGTNNAVKIENLSTGKVEITATPLSDGEKSGSAEFTLYTFNNSFVVTDSTDGKALEIKYTDFFNNHTADEEYHGGLGIGSSLDCYFTNTEVGLKRTFAAATFNDDGSLAQSDKDAIYLNISGKPDSALTTDKTKAEALGTITLSFKIVDGEGKAVDSLTPVVPVAEQGNQG